MPRLKNKTRQYLFKNKLKTKRKSRTKLLKESFLMLVFGFLLLLINYFIPQKVELFKAFKTNIIYISRNILEIIFSSLEVLIVLFISFTILLSLFLILGSINRIIKVIRTKSRKKSIP